MTGPMKQDHKLSKGELMIDRYLIVYAVVLNDVVLQLNQQFC